MSPAPTEIPETWTGYGARDEAHGKKLDLQVIEYKPQAWTEEMVDIKVSVCGVCGSDCHTLTNGWPSPTSYPAVVGHEIVGTVVRAGKESGHEVGARVGVGAQAGSCGKCDLCLRSREQYCSEGMRGTYQGKWADGTIGQGGYATFFRGAGRFAIPVPDHLSDEVAAPLFCAGATMYSPLKRFGAGPGKKVGIIGIGGLGHLGVQFAKALGAETYALSHSDRKIEDAEKLGISRDHFIMTKNEEECAAKWGRKFDILICTAFQNDLPIERLFFKLLAPEGTLVVCGLPEEKLPAMYGHAFVGKGISLAGSLIAGTQEIKDMLVLAAEKDVKPWVEVRPMSEASQTVKDMEEGKAKYRYVLKN